jgi:hypothetical protein
MIVTNAMLQMISNSDVPKLHSGAKTAQHTNGILNEIIN